MSLVSEFMSRRHSARPLRYEVGLTIKNGHMAWVNGPCKHGACTDIVIFRHSTRAKLGTDERVVTDDGYGTERRFADFTFFAMNQLCTREY